MASKENARGPKGSERAAKKGDASSPYRDAARSEKRAPEAEETAWDRWKANLKTIGGAVLLAIFIRIVLFEAFEIEGPSMEPTLLNGDRVVVAKFSYGLFLPFTTEAVTTWGTPKRGDVVIVRSPQDDNIDIVKRVIALPGDTVEIHDDEILVNGVALRTRDLGPCNEIEPHLRGAMSDCHEETVDGEPHRISRDPTSPPSNHPEMVVPDDYLYILGDHRDRSNDSRFFGPIPVTRVKGRALAIYWSSDADVGVRWDRLFDGID
jgi:signal peptidase I